jgi:SHS2 domain-containing protein
MATISIDIPADQETRVYHALCAGSGREDSADNAKQALVDHITITVTNVERSEAMQAAMAAQTAQAPATLGLT